MGRSGIAIAALVVAVGCGSQSGSTNPRDDGSPAGGPNDSASSPEQSDELPGGWRWESFGGVEIGVPDSWGHGTSQQPWCAWGRDRQLGDGPPYVGRPGPIFLIACPSTDPNGGPDPATVVETGGTFVWFDRSPERRSAPMRVEGDRATVTMAGVTVSIQAHQPLRDRIRATLRRIPGGTDGCSVDHPITDDFAWRPEPSPVEKLTGVTAVSACKYDGSSLRSSVRLEGAEAAAAIDRIVAAPIGGGPNSPANCVPAASYGDELIVLEISAAQGTSEIVLRYAGCDHHGFDDGVRVRTLTRDAVAPFIAGANRVTSYQGNLRDILGG